MKCDKKTQQISLKQSHNYFYQVQGQMAITGRTWCDFYVWTPRSTDYFLQHIVADPEFWEDKVRKLTHFYRKSMLPELVAGRHRSNQELQELDSDTEPPFIFYNRLFSEPPIQQRVSHLLRIQSTQDVKTVSSVEETRLEALDWM